MPRAQPRPADVAVGLLAAGELVASVAARGWSGAPGGLIAGSTALLMLGRRRWPLLAATAPFAGLAVALALQRDDPNNVFVALMVTFAVVGAVSSTSVGVAGWATGVTLVVVTAYVADPGAWAADAALTTVFCTVMWGAGWLVGHRTRQATVNRLRAEAAELAGELALREQRDQLARELHDVVSHGLSVVVLQTTAARAGLTDRHSAEDVDRHLAAVEETARSALDEMRRMLGLLQTGHLEPGDGLERVSVEDLVDRAESAGLVVDATEVDLPELPAGLALTVHRVLQEALTNAAKHSPGSRVRVQLRARSDVVEVIVRDDGAAAAPTPGLAGGAGLDGMARRVQLYGGALRVGPEADGGFCVHATLPRPGATGSRPVLEALGEAP